MKSIIVTGAAGFIGSKVSEMLLEKGYQVIGIDSLNDYYDLSLKLWRVNELKNNKLFSFYQINIESYDALKVLFQIYRPVCVINEAARAGVRYSLENPFVYQSTNASGTLNLLDLCREYEVTKFILASTSSLYAGQKMPFVEELSVNRPISPYAASKKAAEAIAYSYHHLYGIDVTILRYFTVYGPAGRPDMSVFRFIKWIKEGAPLEIFGDGSQSRDFTFIDDIARGTIEAMKPLGYEVINLGNNNPRGLMEVIGLIEEYTGMKAQCQYREFHKADMDATWADSSKARKLLNWIPEVSLEEGIKRTFQWTEKNWDWLKNVSL